MRWFDKNSTEEEVMKELSKYGLVKRSMSGVDIRPQLPLKRPLTLPETKILRKYFDTEFKWTDIDANGRIILINLDSKAQVGKYYVTEQDLKDQIEREKLCL